MSRCLSFLIPMLAIGSFSYLVAFSEPIIHLAETKLYYDREQRVLIDNLLAGETISLAVTCRDASNQLWQADAVYKASPQGIVDLSHHAPISGSYQGVQPMGLFWSMKGATRFATSADAHLSLHVTSLDQKNRQATAQFTWLMPLTEKHLRRLSIVKDGLLGQLFLPPKQGKRFPLVLVLGGSGGGFQAERASLLATHGFAALDLAYHGEPGLPDTLVEIPLEYFQKAIDTLADHPEIDISRLAVMGKSKGAELALLLASIESRLKAVISEQPSHVVWAGIGIKGYGKSSWTYAGKPSPFIQMPLAQGMAWLKRVRSGERQIHQTPYMEAAFQNKAAVLKANISVENIAGPMLLISGRDDGLWPSTYMADQILARLERHQHPFKSIHLAFEASGHNFGGGEEAFGNPHLPVSDRSQSTLLRGGDQRGNALAAIGAWQASLAFLKKHIGQEALESQPSPAE